MNNIKLVEHSKMALKEKWGYVYGTFGTVLNEPLLQQKLKQYPKNVQVYEDFIRKNWMNKRAVDCVGLIKSYLWWNGGNVKYNPNQDKSANGMYQLAKEKGPISTIPEIPGILVWKDGHIGVYIGNGQVIESRGTKYGVIQSPLKGNGSAEWTNWCKCPYIGYVEEQPIKSNTKFPPNKVKINLLGKNIIVDGYLKDGTNYIKIGEMYIPVRTIFESIGLTVSWDNGVVVNE